MLPNDFPPWLIVYRWFRRFVRHLLFGTIHDVALMLDRERQAREQSHSAAVVDSQSINAPMAQKRGYDAGKKVLGCKRHIAVETDGRLLIVKLTTADISDSAGAHAIVAAIRKRCPWLKHLFADSAYPPRSGPALTGCQHADRGFVGIDDRCCYDVTGNGIGHGRQPQCGAADPVTQGRPVDIDAIARDDPRLAVERQTVDVFAHDDIGD